MDWVQKNSQILKIEMYLFHSSIRMQMTYLLIGFLLVALPIGQSRWQLVEVKDGVADHVADHLTKPNQLKAGPDYSFTECFRDANGVVTCKTL